MIKILQRFSLFWGYVFFAGIATLVDFGLLYFFTEFVGFYYLFSSALAYLAGMITNYSLNKFFNFKNKSQQITKQFAVFAAVALVGLCLNQFILWSLVEKFHLWYMFSKVISVIIVMFWSFWGHKNFTFKILS